MKTIKLVHNPSAGDEDISADKLVKWIEDAGYQCRYSSTKKDHWKEFEDDVDLVVVAGGDGTIRKVVKQMLRRSVLEKELPLTLLPLGTANNIAKTLNILDRPKSLISRWEKAKKKSIDVGGLYNIEDADFFLESFGYGIFPYLMQEMKKREEEYESAQMELKGALKKLHEIILDYECRECHLEIDGTDHSGKFILAEIMNTKSIGPNLNLAPLNDPGDGELEVVLVPENQKDKFADYIGHLIQDGNEPYQFYTLQGKKIHLSWQGSHVHIDDKVVKLKENQPVSVEIKTGVLCFLVPPAEE